jgi:hypothetical protein
MSLSPLLTGAGATLESKTMSALLEAGRQEYMGLSDEPLLQSRPSSESCTPRLALADASMHAAHLSLEARMTPWNTLLSSLMLNR